MRDTVRALSALSTAGRGNGLGSIRRGALATRASSPSAGGSGAPSRRRARLSALALAIAALALLVFAPLSQAKVVVGGFGTFVSATDNSPGGQISSSDALGASSQILGVGVNSSGVGAPAGTAYVVDAGGIAAGPRIQRFSPTGAFQRLWGKDVVASSVNETQHVVVSATAGTFTLSFAGSTTDPIPFDAAGTDVEDALAALPSIDGDANVAVVAIPGVGAFGVTLTGALAAANQPQLTADTSQLTGSVKISTVVDGHTVSGGSSTGFEICTVAADCKVASTSGTIANGGELSSPQGVAVDQATGNVYVTETGNRRVSEFDADGNFIRAWGWDVATGGATGTGTLSTASTTVSSVSTATGAFKVGQTVTSSTPGDIPAGTTITAVGSNSLTLSQKPIANGVETLTVATGAGNVAVNETQTITVSPGATSGNFKLTFTAPNPQTVTNPQTTANIPFNATVAQVQTALDNLTNIGAANTTVTLNAGGNAGGGAAPGGPWTVTFNGPRYTDANVNALVRANGSPNLNTTTGFAIATTTDGSTGFESCTAVAGCQQALSGANGGEFSTSIGYPTVDGSGNVWVADQTNRRIQEFSSTGAFIAAYGYDIVPTGKPGDLGVGVLESCPASAAATSGNCRAATAGAGAGQFSSALAGSPRQIAFDATGNLYAIDRGNNRVQQFNPTLTSASNFASSTFASYSTASPNQIVSSQGGTRLDFSLVNDVSGGGEQEVVELDPTSPAAPTDTSLVGAGFTARTIAGNPTGDFINNPATAGLAANAAADTLYATANSFASPRKVLVLGASNPDPTLTIKPTTGTTDTAADFSATVDPQGGLLGNCKFQYSTDQSNWTDVPDPDCDTLAANGIQALGEHAVGLTPNTHYYLRLSVSRPLVPSSTVTSSVKAFDTASVPPVVTDAGAIQVADTSARLVATIDPRNSATGYHFEYGTTPDLSTSTSPTAIGGGATPLTVSQVVGGLAKDTTYYYKLVATNAFGSTSSDQKTLHTRAVPFPPADPGNCPNAAIREAQGSTYLPDCRAYEMVSPPDKNVGGVNVGISRASFGANGDAAGFCTNSIFGDPPAQQPQVCAMYVSRRGPDGWQTTSPLPRFCRNDRADGFNDGLQIAHFDANFDRAVIEQPETAACPFPRLDPNAPLPASNIFREDFGTDPFAFDLLAPNPNDAPVPSTLAPTGQFSGASRDFSHVVYASQGNQTPDSPPQASFAKLYDWRQPGPGCGLASPDYLPAIGACLSLVSRDTNDVPFATSASFPYSENANAVSENGNRIYFNTPVANGPPGVRLNPGSCATSINGCNLYMREDATTTYAVSASECTAGCAPTHSADVFTWASSAGDVALFMSCDKLTDESTGFDTSGTDCQGGGGLDDVTGISTLPGNPQAKLYRWDESLPAGHRLLDLTADHEPADGLMPQAKGVLGASSDTAAPPDSNAAPGNTVYFVATGQIVSGAPLDSQMKLYRWRYNAGSPSVDYLGPYAPTHEDPALENGTRNGGVNLIDVHNLVHDPNANSRHIRVSSDGGDLLITSRLPYDPAADRDSDVDVYRWDQADGWTCVSCQLPGAPSAGPASLSGVYAGDANATNPFENTAQRDIAISADGRRIVFSTPDALVPEDVNGAAGCPQVTGAEVGIGLMDGTPVYRCEDVYEWNDGTLSLLTPGTGSDPFVLMGTTADGNVFFETRQRLVGWDTDDGGDMYTTRIDGGFPEPASTGAACQGAEECHGAGTSTPSTTGAGTASFQGPDSPDPVHGCPPGKVRKHGRCVNRPRKKRHHKRHHRRAHRRAANHDRRAAR